MAAKNPLLPVEEAQARARKERELLASLGIVSPAEGVSSCRVALSLSLAVCSVVCVHWHWQPEARAA